MEKRKKLRENQQTYIHRNEYIAEKRHTHKNVGCVLHKFLSF